MKKDKILVDNIPAGELQELERGRKYRHGKLSFTKVSYRKKCKKPLAKGRKKGKREIRKDPLLPSLKGREPAIIIVVDLQS